MSLDTFLDQLRTHQWRALYWRRQAHLIRARDPIAARHAMTIAVCNMHMVKIYIRELEA